MGFEVVLREDIHPARSIRQLLGITYAAACKLAGLERAFPHGNPYHRHAFPTDWWRQVSAGADLAVINYSYWAHLPRTCPRVLVLLDLWSNVMWGGCARETADIAAFDHVFTASCDEARILRERGVPSVSWSPPAVPAPAEPLPMEAAAALVGSANRFNLEGLRWIEQAGAATQELTIRVYGALVEQVRSPAFIRVGRYEDPLTPYRECGIALFTTTGGTGIQIKTIEALAAGRAIVARRGAMRGLPVDRVAWLEVNSAMEMIDCARQLAANPALRIEWGQRALSYYRQHLDAQKIIDEAKSICQQVLRK